MSKSILSDIKRPFPMSAIEVDKGWKPIAQRVVKHIQEVNDILPEGSHIYIDQVKEKYGTLRFSVIYENVPDDVRQSIENLIHEAKKEAAGTCERCGSVQNIGMRLNGWYTTMCEDCAKKTVEEDYFYGKVGLKWRRAGDKKVFLFTKSGKVELPPQKK